MKKKYLIDPKLIAKTIINSQKYPLVFYYYKNDSFVGIPISQGQYEAYETNLLLNIIKEGDVVIDVGANIGYYTLLFSKIVGPKGKVIAIEPDPASFYLLQKNIKANHLKNVITLNVAASDKKSNSFLYLSSENLGDHQMYQNKSQKRNKVPVITNTIDNIINDYKLSKINFIKIDTQGFEPFVIKGAIKTLCQHTPPIALEYWPYGYKKSKANTNTMLTQLNRIYHHNLLIDEKRTSCYKTSTLLTNQYCQQNNGYQHANLIFTNDFTSISQIQKREQGYSHRFSTQPKQMISYAQNAEDVILDRVLNNRGNGFYVDVGAADPTVNSVTKHFYLQGWHGLNIEPTKNFYRLLCADRTRDVNLNIGIGNKPQILPFYECQSVKEWSTFSNKTYRLHRRHGVKFTRRSVKINSLANILNKYAKNIPIDFLKIDTEGHELDILKSNDWTKFRPRIVIVESSRPKTTRLLMKKAKYLYALNDGLNLFFVAQEKKSYLKKLSLPANVCDNFIPYQYYSVLTNQSAKEHQLHAEFQHQRSLIDAELKKTQTAYHQELTKEKELHAEIQHQHSAINTELQKAQKTYFLVDAELKKTQTAYKELFHLIKSYHSSKLYKLWEIQQKLKFSFFQKIKHN